VIVAEDGKVNSIAVEDIPSGLTVTDVEAVMAAL
jgi:2-Cys peroxiredoxin 5